MALERVTHFFPATSELFGLIEALLPDSVPQYSSQLAREIQQKGLAETKMLTLATGKSA
jgi:hypothetical protein